MIYGKWRMTLEELKRKYPAIGWINGPWSVGIGHTPPLYDTYGILLRPDKFEHQKLSLEAIEPIYLGEGNNGNFNADLELEERTYRLLLKPYLEKHGHDTIFLHIDSESFCEEMQKKHDIDVLGDTGKINYSRSIKSIRNWYYPIFWEVIKNSNTGELGWGLTTKAEKVWYCTPKEVIENKAKEYRVIICEPFSVVGTLRG